MLDKRSVKVRFFPRGLFTSYEVRSILYYMKLCHDCGKPIPPSIIENGVYKQLINRKFCLLCSPYKQRSRQSGRPSQLFNVTCKCGREYVYNSRNKQGHTRTKCNSCMVNTRRPLLKAKALEYKGGCCTRCGYNKSKRALVFHHHGEGKDFTISNPPSQKWEVLQPELDRCTLLCANCHAEAHDEIDAGKLSCCG